MSRATSATPFPVHSLHCSGANVSTQAEAGSRKPPPPGYPWQLPLPSPTSARASHNGRLNIWVHVMSGGLGAPMAMYIFPEGLSTLPRGLRLRPRRGLPFPADRANFDLKGSQINSEPLSGSQSAPVPETGSKTGFRLASRLWVFWGLSCCVGEEGKSEGRNTRFPSPQSRDTCTIRALS